MSPHSTSLKCVSLILIKVGSCFFIPVESSRIGLQFYMPLVKISGDILITFCIWCLICEFMGEGILGITVWLRASDRFAS